MSRPEKKDRCTRFSFSIPDEMRNRIKTVAKDLGTHESVVVKMAITQLLAKPEYSK